MYSHIWKRYPEYCKNVCPRYPEYTTHFVHDTPNIVHDTPNLSTIPRISPYIYPQPKF